MVYWMLLIKLSTGIKIYLKVSKDTAAITLKKVAQYNGYSYNVILLNEHVYISL